MFRDREEAGRKLGAELEKLQLENPIVLALPRGGVPVAVEIAKALKAPLDLAIVRKVGAPGNPELAAAAIVDGDPPDVVLNRDVVEAYSLGDDELRVLVAKERPELERRRTAYRGKRAPLEICGKTVIIVDDGAATGTTMKVAIRALKRRSPRQIVVALPVASPETLTDLAYEADWTVCLSEPAHFRALSQNYLKFPQLSDDDVVSIWDEAARVQNTGRRGNPRRDGDAAADGDTATAKE
ncbi:MAG: phosphoribosyltransferase [Mesorhizobium sp.]|uniref:phosphoribosyltransferase n=1 Tax=unclassified Mesorhizobium TaxID=325217 RepID=UPI000FCA7850|nr:MULTISPECIES: phosphoribosyltransferase [unclassified Mesorhizobium]RUV91833.1 phosphoribosyltransferase [Mesorhizobium sp. M1A.F.Ca.IN.020.04.1.1]RUW01061.1 phosphoribosyltransferase [Mesorhizobium sp. M1A.F.Ca.IN.020.03.1.1]RWF69560.1 MAG: phosphoribosyltransferase [Mesorhizobium sp.]RWG11542.1 MAG: phosphoribosyltransferase [Mesorhizobium sp.]RWG25607.1 MAG: phosphoribosyltransferase [Mesorhizobium sp.]